MKKRICLTLASFYLFSLCVFSDGADSAYPVLSEIFQQMPIKEATLYTFSDQELIHIFDKSVELEINLFEFVDCLYRYLNPRNMRVRILGDSFRNAQSLFDYGGDPVELLLPIQRIIKVEVGAAITEDQKALDMYLDAPYSAYIDVATAVYETRCGFSKLEPLTFSQSYGMFIKKWTITKPVRKIHLYDSLQAAIYAEGFFRPKKWWLWKITRIPQTNSN